MQEDPIQILEVRASQPPQPATVTASVSADASRAIFVALSEQLDRRRRVLATGVEDVLALRDQTALVERFAPLASAGAHTIAQFTDAELRACLLELSAYVNRVDGEHFQALELRERLETITQFSPVLWEANAAAAAAAAGSETLPRFPT